MTQKYRFNFCPECGAPVEFSTFHCDNCNHQVSEEYPWFTGTFEGNIHLMSSAFNHVSYEIINETGEIPNEVT